MKDENLNLEDQKILALFEPQILEYDLLENEDYSMLEEVLERNERIQRIAQDSYLLSDMFKDLKELVFSQQDSIDTISENIGRAKTHTENAEEQLLEAEEYQKKSMRNYVILSSMLITGASVPVGLTLGTKAALGTAGGLGMGTILYKFI